MRYLLGYRNPSNTDLIDYKGTVKCNCSKSCWQVIFFQVGLEYSLPKISVYLHIPPEKNK